MMRLDKYLAERTGMTRSESRKAITKGRISVDGAICRKADAQLDENTAAVALDGTPRQIFSQVERMRELSLSVPQTVELLYTLDRDGAVLSLEALSVEECADEILKYLEA